MRIHIENLTGKAEELEAELGEKRESSEEEMASLKREKRRLDDLLTIREGEIERMEKMFNDAAE
jgi:predicted nuclease with TOPRIM domain